MSESILDLSNPKPFDKFDRRVQEHVDTHKMSKRRQAPVSTTLGLVHVRFADISISHIPIIELRLASMLSLLAFHTPETLRTTPFASEVFPQMEVGFPMCITPGNPSDIQATLWHMKQSRTLYIAFRGNHDLDEVFPALGLSESHDGCIDESHHVVNDWFAEDFKRIEIFLRPILQERTQSTDRIVCIGAGLGGAVATIAAPFIGELLKRKCDCITFGSPKVGNRDFVEWYKLHVDKTHRVIYSNDPLPYLPFSRRDMEHVTDSICISKNGYLEKWPRTLRASPNILVGISKIDFDDFQWEHFANKYRKIILAAIIRDKKGLETFRVHNKLVRGTIVSPMY